MVNLVDLLETGVTDYRPGPRPATSEEIAKTFEDGTQRAIERARSMKDDIWKGPGKFLFAGQVAWEASGRLVPES